MSVPAFSCDVLIIGSGAGGAMVADALRPLAKAGADIVICEAGPYYKHEDFNQRGWDMSRLYWERGATPNQNFSLTVARGKAVGGSTTVYTGVTFRIAEETHAAWQKKGYPLSFQKMQAEYALLEREISAQELPESMVNENNATFRRGCEALGLPCHRLKLNVKDCEECGFCNLGCRYKAMQNMMTVYLPQALQDGITLLPQCELLELREKEALFQLHHPAKWKTRQLSPSKIAFKAKVIVMACGTMATPKLLMQSPLTQHLPGLGKGISTHPATMIYGIHPKKITNTRAFPKTFFTDAFVNQGILLETAFYFPFIVARMMPGTGREHAQFMEQYHKMACILCLTHQQKREANRFYRKGRKISFWYEIDKDTQGMLVEGVRQAARILFKGGCEKVVSPLIDGGFLASTEQEKIDHKIDINVFRRRWIVTSSAHPQGGCALGTGEDAVCLPTGQVKGVPYLFVADASLFPECSVVNPHLTVMITARIVGQEIAARLS